MSRTDTTAIMIDDADVRSWLKDNFGHDFGTEKFVMPQNAAGTWLVEPKALGPMWSETCQMNFQWLFRETVLNTSLMDSINLHGVMKPIIIDGTKTNRVRKFEIVDGIPPVSYCPRCGALIWPDTTRRCINGQPENDAEYYRRILETYKNNPDPLFCHNCGQRFKYVGQDQLAYKHQSNRADILRTLKLKAETQPTFDLTELK